MSDFENEDKNGPYRLYPFVLQNHFNSCFLLLQFSIVQASRVQCYTDVFVECTHS